RKRDLNIFGEVHLESFPMASDKTELVQDDIPVPVAMEAEPNTVQTPTEKEDTTVEVRRKSTGVYSQGLINISLLSANATQLRSAQSDDKYEYQTTVIALIATSIFIQLLILLCLVALSIMPRRKLDHNEPYFVFKWILKKRVKSIILLLVSVLTAVNIFISTYHQAG
uniref:Ninjurin-1 n=1 Tax=Magallana gigas TaxID=29159 RepID=A0A8W8K4H2_MAGGI